MPLPTSPTPQRFPLPPYLLQEAETGQYLTQRPDGQLALRRSPDGALRFQTSAQAIEYRSTLREVPVDVVRVVA